MNLSPTIDAPRNRNRVALTTARFDERLTGEAIVWTGVIESVFAQAAVVRPDRGGEALTLLHPSRGLVPLGLAVPWARLQPIEGERVRLGGRRLWLVDRWNRGRYVALIGKGVSLQLQALGAGCRIALRRQLDELPLPERSRTLLDGDPLPAGTLARAEIELLAGSLSRLVKLLARNEQGPALRTAVHALVGLGSGSTPTGDDLLVGCAAALRSFAAAGWVATDALDAFNRGLAAVTPADTTAVGCAMLAQASTGAFVEPLLDLVHALGRPDAAAERLDRAVHALSDLGQHSGAEMLTGVVAVGHEVTAQIRRGGLR